MLKKNIPSRILSIKPGSNYWGVVVLEGRHLVFRTVKNLKPCATRQELISDAKKLIKRLLHIHQPDIVIQEQLCYVQSLDSERVVEIAKEIKISCEHLTYREISPMIAKEFICVGYRVNQINTAHLLASIYPQTKQYLTKSKFWYWKRMFDSLAVAHYYRQQSDN